LDFYVSSFWLKIAILGPKFYIFGAKFNILTPKDTSLHDSARF